MKKTIIILMAALLLTASAFATFVIIKKNAHYHVLSASS